MVMAVNPGWGGQKFIPSALDKVKQLRTEINRRGLNVNIEVDGGVNLTTGPQCVLAGADVLVAGSFVYNDKAPIGDNIRTLRTALDAARA